MTTPTTPVTGVSSAIEGSFDPIDGLPVDIQNTWAFKYNQNTNAISFNVSVGIPPMLIDNSEQSLKSEIQIADVDQLINWLAIVKMNVNKNKGGK